MRRAIVTGASGFIGQALTAALLEQGTEVYGLCAHPDKLGATRSHPGFHLVQVSFEDYGDLAAIMPREEFDVFFHFAWQGYGKATNDYRVQVPNIKYACDAASAAAALGCRRFVFADSSHEFLVLETQDNQLAYCSIYGAAKHAAQRLCKALLAGTRTEFVGVLFTNVFGVGDRSARSANTMLRKLMAGEDLDLVPGERLYDWTYIDDCVGGVLAAAEKGKPGKVYYVGSRVLRPFFEIITDVRDTVAPNAELHFGKFNDDTFINYDQINTYELYNDTGFLPGADFAEGVRKTKEWLRGMDTENKDVN